MTNLDAGTIAMLALTVASIDANGGSIDLHTDNRGNDYAPKNPTYLVGGVVPGIAYKSSELATMNPEQFGDIALALTGMIIQGENAGGTVVGWWENDGIVYFDVSEEIDADVFSIKLALNLAYKRNQQAIGLYLGGKYAHTINAV